jgi:hypothetical protein
MLELIGATGAAPPVPIDDSDVDDRDVAPC